MARNTHSTHAHNTLVQCYELTAQTSSSSKKCWLIHITTRFIRSLTGKETKDLGLVVLKGAWI